MAGGIGGKLTDKAIKAFVAKRRSAARSSPMAAGYIFSSLQRAVPLGASNTGLTARKRSTPLAPTLFRLAAARVELNRG